MTVRLLRPNSGEEATPSFAEATDDRDDGNTTESMDTECPPVLPGNDSLDGLAKMAGVEKLAREAEQSVRPRDTLEELLTHELIAGHAFAMNVLCQANNQFLAVDDQAADLDHMTRLNQATAQTGMVGVHMMAAVQRGVLLLDRLRNGHRFHYTVEKIAGTPAGVESGSEPAAGSEPGS